MNPEPVSIRLDLVTTAPDRIATNPRVVAINLDLRASEEDPSGRPWPRGCRPSRATASERRHVGGSLLSTPFRSSGPQPAL
jgi:hypothetical protein